MFFIETSKLLLNWNENRQNTGAKKRQTSNKFSTNKLPVRALNKLLKRQASDISPLFFENSLRLHVYNMGENCSCLVEAHRKHIWHFCKSSDKKKMEQIQERTLRAVFKSKSETYSKLLTRAGLPSLYQQRLQAI